MSLKDLGNPTINTLDQEINVTASISGLPNESYFRVEWQKSTGDTYFGSIKFNDSWVEVNASQDCKNYLHISDTSTSNFVVLTKIGNIKSPENGSYNLKLRRYTASCASYSDSDPINVMLNLPSPVPTPTTAPTASPTKMPMPTVSPSHNPTPIKTPTLLLAPKETTPMKLPTY